jgi:hypothetical protein
MKKLPLFDRFLTFVSKLHPRLNKFITPALNTRAFDRIRVYNMALLERANTISAEKTHPGELQPIARQQMENIMELILHPVEFPPSKVKPETAEFKDLVALNSHQFTDRL